MKVVSKAIQTVLTILGKTKSEDGCSYRWMHFCAQTTVDDGVLAYNLLTKELLLLSQEEYDHCFDIDYLKEHWFVVPEHTKDKEHADLLKWVLSVRQKKSENITSYTIFPTTDCNARCFYCFELGRSRMPMNHETALKVVQYIKSHCGGEKVSIQWFGGEPLYNQNAIDTICSGLRNEGVAFSSSMVSNAYLFDDLTIKKAVELWNVKKVQVTLDGTEETYNRIKAFIYKEGNPYQRVLDNICKLLDANIYVSIRMNMDLYNADDLLLLTEELAQRFSGRKNICAYAHHLFKNNESMADTHTDEEWALRDKAMHRIEEQLMQSGLVAKHGIRKKPKLYRCMADADQAVTILPDGNIGVCEHFSETEYIGHIDREGFDREMVASWKETVPVIEECAECFYYPDCIMLKKCANANKCYPQQRELRLRSLRRQMETEYKKWRSHAKEEDEAVDVFADRQ